MAINPVKIVSLVLLGLTTLLCIVALATEHWYSYSVGSIDGHGNLFKACVKVQVTSTVSTSGCVDFSDVPGSFRGQSKLDAARALAIIAILVSPGAAVLLIISMKSDRGRLFTYLAGGIVLFQVAMQGGAVGAAGSWMKDDIHISNVLNVEFAWSFYMAAVMIGLYFVNAILIIVSAAVDSSA